MAKTWVNLPYHIIFELFLSHAGLTSYGLESCEFFVLRHEGVREEISNGRLFSESGRNGLQVIEDSSLNNK